MLKSFQTAFAANVHVAEGQIAREEIQGDQNKTESMFMMGHF
jgi:hypothetical protein